MKENEFIEELAKIGINISNEQLLKLKSFYDLLISWNEKINLTRITLKEDVYLKHFYDSLTLYKVVDLNKDLTICDVGSGAGFPGLVLKIFYPNLEITLVDALQKRVNYLNKVIKDLNLNGIEAIHIRAEDLARKGNRYDIVTARAVANLSKLLSWTMPLVKKNGYFVAMKGNVVDELEMAQSILKRKNYILDSKVEFKLPKEGSNRTILKIKCN